MPALGSVGRSGRGWNSILPVSPGHRMVSQSMSSRWRISQGWWRCLVSTGVMGSSSMEIRASAVFPLRRTFLQEGVDAFLGIARKHVAGHHLARVDVGVGERQLGLAIEGLLADLDCEGRLAGDLARERRHLRVELRLGHDAVDEAELARAGGVDEIA